MLHLPIIKCMLSIKNWEVQKNNRPLHNLEGLEESSVSQKKTPFKLSCKTIMSSAMPYHCLFAAEPIALVDRPDVRHGEWSVPWNPVDEPEWVGQRVDVNPTCLTDEAPTDFECNELLHFTNRVTDRISLKSNLLWSRPEILDVFFDVEVLESHKDRKEKQKISWKVGWVEELGIYCFQTLPSEPGYERKQRLLICNTKEVRFIQTNMSEQVTKKKKKRGTIYWELKKRE